MAELIKAYLPNVYKMGWSGQAGWGDSYLLDPLYDGSFLHHRRFPRAGCRAFPCLDSSRWCLGK